MLTILYLYWMIGAFRRIPPRLETEFPELALLRRGRSQKAFAYEEAILDSFEMATAGPTSPGDQSPLWGPTETFVSTLERTKGHYRVRVRGMGGRQQENLLTFLRVLQAIPLIDTDLSAEDRLYLP